MLLDTYLPIAIFAVIALGVPIFAFWMSRFFRPTKVTALKRETYECGEVPIGEAQVQFHFQFYMFAIIFVVFDIVTVFLMIWALIFSDPFRRCKDSHACLLRTAPGRGLLRPEEGGEIMDLSAIPRTPSP